MKAKRKKNGAANGRDEERVIDFGPLPGYLGYQIRQAQAVLFRDFAALAADLKVTPGEFGLLTIIDANPGICQIDLASVYKLDKSTLSLAVSRLVRRGLIRRTRSRKDERFYALFLQRAGQAQLQRVRARVDEQERTMAAVLRPGQRELMLDLLQRISRALDR